MNEGIEDREWRIATLIKLVAEENVRAISQVASQLRKYYEVEDISGVDNSMVYECYCKVCGGMT